MKYIQPVIYLSFPEGRYLIVSVNLFLRHTSLYRMSIFASSFFYSGQFRERTRLESDRGTTLLCLRIGQCYRSSDRKHNGAFESAFAVQQRNSSWQNTANRWSGMDRKSSETLAVPGWSFISIHVLVIMYKCHEIRKTYLCILFVCFSVVVNDWCDWIQRNMHYFRFSNTEYIIGYISDRPITVEYILEFLRWHWNFRSYVTSVGRSQVRVRYWWVWCLL